MSNTTTYELKGRLDGTTAVKHEQALETLLVTQQPQVLIDMSELDLISSAGLRVLLLAAKKARANGGEVSLKAPKPSVREVLRISAFDKIMKIID
jgi:anti-sigma B factor antagonist